MLLHAPGGYIGASASFELGYASALNIPCFCYELPADEMLATQVRPASSVFEILDLLAVASF